MIAESALIASLLGAASLAAADFPIYLNEKAGVARAGEWVTSGLPLPESAVRDPRSLGLSLAGAPVEAEFLPAAYWHDGSLRWVLAIFKADIAAGAQKQYVVGASAGAPAGIAAVTAGTLITVNTGPLKVEINAGGFNLFNRVWLDKNGDGSFTDDELMVSPSSANGAVVVHRDTKAAHFSALGPVRKAVVEENGPLRVCVLVRGTHAAQTGGVAGGMYDYLTRLYFYKGSATVRVLHTLCNGRSASRSGPQAAVIPAASYSLIQKFNLGAASFRLPASPLPGGEAALEGALAAADSVEVFQGGDGTACWNNACNQGYAEQTAFIYGQNKYPFRGFRVVRAGAAAQQGDEAAGSVDLYDSNWGVTVAVAHFGALFPIALTAKGDGRVAVGLWPADYAGSKWLPYLMTKTYEVTYAFHVGPKPAAALADEAKASLRPLAAVPAPAYVAATRALDGEFFDAKAYKFATLPQTGADFFVDTAPDSLLQTPGMQNGWQYFDWAFGEWYGNMHGASAQMQPQIYKYLNTQGQSYAYLERVKAYAEHTRDIRRWHLEDVQVNSKQDAGYSDMMTMIFGSQEQFPQMAYSYPDGLAEATTNFGWGMNFLDPITSGVQDRGHGGMYQLLEDYYLTGDRRAAESFGERIHILNGLTYYGFGDDTRMAGFFLNDLSRYGSVLDRGGAEFKTIQAGLKLQLRNIKFRLIEMRAGAFSIVGPDCGNNIARQDTHEKPYMLGKLMMGAFEAWRLHREPDALDILYATSYFLRTKNNGGYDYCIPVFSQPIPGPGQLTDEELQGFGAAYLATGNRDLWNTLKTGWESYFSNIVKSNPQYKWSSLGSGYLLTAAQAVANPRADSVPPAPVKDLRAYYDEAGTGVYLAWTAPADNSGKKPKRYQIKYFDHGRVVEWHAFSAKGKAILKPEATPANPDTATYDYWTGNAATSHWWSRDVDTISYWMGYNAGILDGDSLKASGLQQTYHLPASALGQLTVPLAQAAFFLKAFDASENLGAMSNVAQGLGSYKDYQAGVRKPGPRYGLGFAAENAPGGVVFRVTGVLPDDEAATLGIYDVGGRERASLKLALHRGEVSVRLPWNGAAGAPAPRGSYLARLSAPGKRLEAAFQILP